jgi:hypothetical protein
MELNRASNGKNFFIDFLPYVLLSTCKLSVDDIKVELQRYAAI